MMKTVYFLGAVLILLLRCSSCEGGLRRHGVCSWIYHNNTNCLRQKFPCDNGVCIDRGLFCNGRDDCGDNSDERYCGCAYRTCSGNKGMEPCPEDYSKKHIPTYWFCDGIPDCPGGTDEYSCERLSKENGQTSKERAFKWLTIQKKSEHVTETWGSLVDKSAVAFYLSKDYSWTMESNETRRHMAYEVTIQLLSRLSKKKLRDIPSSDLASYVNALLVTCMDPRKFHGLDIVQELRNRVDNHNFTNPYVLLSLCNAGDTITGTDRKKLFNAFWMNHTIFWTDVQAVAIMALACANKQPGNDDEFVDLSELVMELTKHQYSNGTVENLQTTALVLQALFSAQPDEDPENFDETKALQQIFAMQRPDGSFGSLMDTYYVLPVLNCKSLVNISADHCESFQKDEISALDDLITRSGQKVHVRYSLWIGNDKDLERHLALRVPANISFYGIMEMAADIDSHYRFEYVVKENKPFVNALSGLKNDPEKGKYWFLYTIKEKKPEPSQASPADMIPKENDHFVMWYRSGSWIY